MLVEERNKCYTARDAYYSCLDEAGPKRAVKSALKEYKRACPGSWVKHFDDKRETELRVKIVLETRAAEATAAKAAAAAATAKAAAA
mmetsp:Transcript_31677/g.79568  ORF Transcript_31677/g.79568 Transcript_31677/m.79568 type:complete len:87 (-) Transcript_31677:1024-1284(-)